MGISLTKHDRTGKISPKMQQSVFALLDGRARHQKRSRSNFVQQLIIDSASRQRARIEGGRLTFREARQELARRSASVRKRRASRRRASDALLARKKLT